MSIATMVYLQIEKDGKRVSRPVLQPGKHLIGRDADCDLHLDHPGVSRRHAQLIYTSDRLHVIDLGGRNGTFVNGDRVRQHELTPGDKVQIAAYTITIADGGKTTPSESAPANERSEIKSKSYLKYTASAALVLVAGISFYTLSVRGDERANHQASATRSTEELAAAADSVAVEDKHVSPSEIADQDLPPKTSSPAMESGSKPGAPPKSRRRSAVSPKAKDGQSVLASLKNPKSDAPASHKREAPPIPAAETQTASAGKTPSQPVTPAPPHMRSALQQDMPAPQQTTPTLQKESPAPASDLAGKTESPGQSERPALTAEQIHEAERLYWQAYQIMQYKNRNARMQALVLLKKAQEAAPDKNYEYYLKAQEKIDLLTKELAASENH